MFEELKSYPAHNNHTYQVNKWFLWLEAKIVISSSTTYFLIYKTQQML
jgi:hypothetical protein